MTWDEVCASPYLQDLPFKVELDDLGQVLMSPASNPHAVYQGEIIYWLRRLGRAGRAIGECSIATAQGVKVPDAAWASKSFLTLHGQSTPFTTAPEVCVEVVSPTNSRAAIEQKKSLYFAAGAQEVWLCSAAGSMTFWSARGVMAKSQIFPRFPRRVDE